MKRIINKYITLILLLNTFLLAGCSDSFLDEESKEQMLGDNLYTNYGGFINAKNSLLSFVREERKEPIQSAELGSFWKIGTDVAWANSEFSWNRGLNRYTAADLTSVMQFLNGDTSGGPGVFLIMYKIINAANVLISRSESSDIDWLGGTDAQNEIRKNEIVAHAKLMRAWAYRHLVYTFGPVPLSTEEITGANYRDDWERDPVSKIQTQIEEDLLFAEKWLPDNSNDVTRLSSAIASHYLAELYLWQDRNDEAEKKAKAVIDNPNYKLITARYGVKAGEPGSPFMDQFYHGNIMPSKGNTEGLWILPNATEDKHLGQYSNTMRRTWVSPYHEQGITISPENGGRGIGRAAITAWVFSIYEPQDDRFSEYAVRKQYVMKDANTGREVVYKCDMDKSGMSKGSTNPLWASTRKWDWTYDEPAKWNTVYSFADQTYLRLADTYLLLAEALHKQGKNSATDGAAFYINEVRTRSKATPISATDVTIDYILDERARELVTEEHRRHTLVRTGKLIERTRKYNHIASGERNGIPGIQDFHVLLPFPQKIIDTNVGHKMDQNYGY